MDYDTSEYIVSSIAARIPADLWTRVDQTAMPSFAADLLLNFLPTQFELALLRMTAEPHIAPSPDDYLNMQRAVLRTMTARHIEAVLQLGRHNEKAQALYDRFLKETGEED